jgi:hypothetical protein
MHKEGPLYLKSVTRNLCNWTEEMYLFIKFHEQAWHGIANRLGDLEIGCRFPAGASNFSVLRSVQTGPGVHTAFYLMDMGALFLGKRPG